MKKLSDILPAVLDQYGITMNQGDREMKVCEEYSELIEDGMIAMVTSGMDCDCVEWENEVSIVKAEDADKRADSEREWADGPISIKWMKPSEAAKLNKTSRDRIAEAHEDGHPWSV